MQRTMRSTGEGWRPDAPRPRVLVVDDDPTVCRAVAQILSALGDVVPVESLAEAHRVLDVTHDWAGAVIDMVLRPGSGIDVVDRLQVEHPNLPMLVITGDLVPERVNDAWQRRVELLAKPFKTEALLAWAARALEAWRRPMPTRDLPVEMPEDLRRLATRVIRASNCVAQAQGTYAEHLGVLARAASGRRLAGRSATAACAEAIGVSRQVLQAAGSVAARISQPDVQDLFSRRDCNGRHITPSHLVAISRLPHSMRARLIERIFNEGLGVYEVRSLAARLIESLAARG
jgi:CheY-like chemotaxis protein